jgi:hypothetical protein
MPHSKIIRATCTWPIFHSTYPVASVVEGQFIRRIIAPVLTTLPIAAAKMLDAKEDSNEIFCLL